MPGSDDIVQRDGCHGHSRDDQRCRIRCSHGPRGLKSAIYNVRINLPNISDQAFDQEVRGKLDGLLQSADEAARVVEGFVEAALEG